MSMEYIRTMYNVPAKRGGRIRFTHSDGTVEYGTITGTNNPHLRVRIDGQKHSLILIVIFNYGVYSGNIISS